MRSQHLAQIERLINAKKKISDQKSASKAKAARISASKRQTGGGPISMEELDELDEMVVAKMPKVSYEASY